MQQEYLFPIETKEYTARQINIINSPKRSGNCDVDSKPYLEELDRYCKQKTTHTIFSKCK